MVRVSPIKLQVGTKVLWFDPQDFDVKRGDNVIVDTERGQEYGTATADVMDVTEALISRLRSPLKPVVRLADEADAQRASELRHRGEEALPTFKELAAQTNAEMRPVAVDFLFSGDKAVFYFESEQRVDFRDLVRKLASQFHVRVDMRQIGVRDGARIVGGLGHCGQELCCKRMGGEFSPVSIRMAKEQNLSLNPQKISGCCGRLMCCLRYEYDTYKEVNARAPKQGAKIEIPGGEARVTEVNVPLEEVTLQLEDGKSIKIPLDEMQTTGESKRPNSISQEVLDAHAAPDPLDLLASSSFEVASFTAEDKLADPAARPNFKESQERSGESHRKPRRRRGRGASGAKSSTDQAPEATSRSKRRSPDGALENEGSRPGGTQARKPRRRRGNRRTAHQDAHTQKNNSSSRSQQAQAQGQHSVRPGQKSSGVRNAPHDGTSASSKGEVAHRRPRRRRSSGGRGPDAASSE